MADVFLYAPQDFRNLCSLSRTLDVLGIRRCFIFDPRRLVRSRYGKSRARELRVVSAGAFSEIEWRTIEEPERFFAEYSGRVVATVPGARASALSQFRFAPSDLLLFGSESQGLPAPIVEGCAATIAIASLGRTQSLNLAVALGIVVFECLRQLEPPIFDSAATLPTVSDAK